MHFFGDVYKNTQKSNSFPYPALDLILVLRLFRLPPFAFAYKKREGP